MPARFIVPITDCFDIAAAEIRMALLAELGYDQRVSVEPAVPVSPPLSLVNAMFAVRLMAEAYPGGSVFLVTINPEKNRHTSLVGRTEKKDLTFVARDHGVLTWLQRDFGIAEVYSADRHYGPTDTAFKPFAGKYVSAPLAARAAMGTPLHELGDPFDVAGMTKLEVPDGTIVHIDNFGLIKFAGSFEALGISEGDPLEVSVAGRTIKAVGGTRMMNFGTGEWVVYPGSSFGLPELGQVRGPGAPELGARVGDRLSVRALS